MPESEFLFHANMNNLTTIGSLYFSGDQRNSLFGAIDHTKTVSSFSQRRAYVYTVFVKFRILSGGGCPTFEEYYLEAQHR
jgi:hypothetical protein